jgi:DNA-binding NtrC family response regulator/tetratricopeptide (TPR) repeat protein
LFEETGRLRGQLSAAAEVADCISQLALGAQRGARLDPALHQATRTAIRLVRNVDAVSVSALMAAFADLSATGEPAVVSRLHALRSNLALRHGRYQDALLEATEGRSLALANQLEYEISLCCGFAGAACQWSGRLSEAESWFDEAIVAARRCGDQAAEAGALSSKSILLQMRGDSDSSLRMLDQAAATFSALGEEKKLARCRLSRGILYCKTGRLGVATSELRLALVQFETFEQYRFADSARLALARALIIQCEFEEARTLLDQVLESPNLVPDPRRSVIAHEYLGDLLREQGNLEAATEHHSAAWQSARELGEDTDLFVEASHRYALSLSLGGAFNSESELIAQAAIRIASSQGDRYELAAALCASGRGLIAAGRYSEAKAPLREGLDVAGRIGDRLTRAMAALALSRVTFQLGDPVEAAGLAHEARREFAQLPSPRWLAETETWLTELMAKLATAVAASNAAGGSAEPGDAAAASDPSAKPARPHRPSTRTTPDSGPVAGIPTFITADSSVRQMLATTLKIAPRSLSILVLGESGTGKEIVAEAIHAASNRKGPFVPVNCGALPGELLEAELFGHAKGAYTGADRERGGLIEHSHRGTLFLDEIGDMPLKAQARLLRALERGEIRRLGEVTPRLVDLRIIAATHRNLLEMVSAGDFRLDLYHRLTGFVLKLPPLRERAADVLLLIDHYVKLFTVEQDKDVRLSPDVRQELAHHAWPGNVRQLRNVLHRLVSLAEPGQTIARLPFELEGEAHPRSFSEVLDAEEKRRILDALQSHNWNKAKAALALGSSRTTLIGKMKRLGIDLESPGARVR